MGLKSEVLSREGEVTSLYQLCAFSNSGPPEILLFIREANAGETVYCTRTKGFYNQSLFALLIGSANPLEMYKMGDN